MRTSGLDTARTGQRALARSGAADRARTLYFIAASVLAALIPLILFAGLWVRNELNEAERDLEAFLTTRATGLSARIDAEIQQQLSVLQAIAALPSLDEPNLALFHAAANRMVGSMPQWAVIGLLDPQSGRQVVNTLRPVGTELPLTTAPDIVRQVATTREPAVNTRYAGQGGVYTENTVLLFVPVIRDGTVRFVLSAGMKADVVQGLLQPFQEPGLLSVVVDEGGFILARSRSVEQFRGRQSNDQLRRATQERDGGYFSAPTLDGQEVFTAFQRSTITGWVAVAATDQAQFDALSDRSTWTLIGTGALALTIAIVLGVLLFYNVVERRVSDERYAASRALSELDARLLATTQEALAEQRKAASEREVLLREIYHRVKNNLQIIQSLLRLGSRDLRPEQREPFEAAVMRIGAMARVHTLLYRSPDLASIDFKDYLEEVVRETADGFGADLRGITTELDAGSMRVPLDTAVPLAFITVEILTNAFKHAFPDGRRGTIKVAARQDGDEGSLVISDDGVGVPAVAGRKRPLGLNLVSKLVEQIGGTLQSPEPGGSTYQVRFSLQPLSPPRIPT
jgi:two-component sensor histidine kinase